MVVDDGLVLADAFVSSSREDHVLDEDMRNTLKKFIKSGMLLMT